MPYTMRKTPRSSFMTMGDTTSTATYTMGISPVAVVASPPFAVPSGVMPMTPSPPTPAPSSGLGQYVLWGGLAYLAYWLWSKE
jgi:hypothetical protein